MVDVWVRTNNSAVCQFDTETSLYCYRARYYDQVAGRFLSEDPKRFKGGSTDFYSYARNNAVNGSDPYGLWTINLGGSGNIQTGFINWQFSGGIIIGSDGGLGTYITKGIAAGIGGGGFFGLSGGISSAKSICGFGGGFQETSESAGAGVSESASAYTGFDSTNGNAPIVGGSVTVGAGGGAKMVSGVTFTTVTPIIPGSGGCGCQ